MADNDGPPKPKPGSLRDRIAAFEKPANAGPAPPPPRPKPGHVLWKPKASSPPSSPSNVEKEQDNSEHKGPAGGFSVADAKASITAGGGLKARMAALQGRGAFGAPAPAAPPPKPASDKPKWKPPPPPSSPPPGGNPLAAVIRPRSPPVTAPESTSPEDENKSSDEGAEKTPEAVADPDEEERQRRAAIAARMARLGGARVGMAPPVFGKKPDPKRPEAPKVEERVEGRDEGEWQATHDTEDTSTGKRGSMDSSEVAPVQVNPAASVSETSLLTSDSASVKSSRSPPPSVPLPSLPRRAGPPRKKSSQKSISPSAASEEPSNASLDTLATHEEIHVESEHTEAPPTPEQVPEDAPEAAASHVTELPPASEHEIDDVSAHADAPAAPDVLAGHEHEHEQAEAVEVSDVAGEQHEDHEAGEPQIVEEEEEDEAARRKRIADRLAKSGGFNPFSLPPPRQASVSSEPEGDAPSPVSPGLGRRGSSRQSSVDQPSASPPPPPPVPRRSSTLASHDGEQPKPPLATADIDEHEEEEQNEELQDDRYDTESDYELSHEIPEQDAGESSEEHERDIQAEHYVKPQSPADEDYEPIENVQADLQSQDDDLEASSEHEVHEQWNESFDHEADTSSQYEHEAHEQRDDDEFHDAYSEEGHADQYGQMDEDEEEPPPPVPPRHTRPIPPIRAEDEIPASPDRFPSPVAQKPVSVTRRSLPPPPRAVPPPPPPEAIEPDNRIEEDSEEHEHLSESAEPEEELEDEDVPTHDVEAERSSSEPLQEETAGFTHDEEQKEEADETPPPPPPRRQSTHQIVRLLNAPAFQTNVRADVDNRDYQPPAPPIPTSTRPPIPQGIAPKTPEPFDSRFPTDLTLPPPRPRTSLPPPPKVQPTPPKLADLPPPLKFTPSAVLGAETEEAEMDDSTGEILDEQDGDPIDPSFHSPPPAHSPLFSPPLSAAVLGSARSPSSGNSSPRSARTPPPAEEGDGELTRRKTIADRLAKLGGIKFGAPPIPRVRSPPPAPSEPKEGADADAERPSLDEDEPAPLSPEEEEANRKSRIAAKLASMGGMRLGMLPMAAKPPLIPRSKPHSDETASMSTVTPSVPTKPMTSPSLDVDIDSESFSVTDSDIVKVSEEEESSGMDEVTREEAHEETPPPIPSRINRASVASTARPAVPSPMRAMPPQPAAAASPTSPQAPPPLPPGRRPTGPSGRPPIPSIPSGLGARRPSSRVSSGSSARKASGEQFEPISSPTYPPTQSEFVMVDSHKEQEEAPPPVPSRMGRMIGRAMSLKHRDNLPSPPKSSSPPPLPPSKPVFKEGKSEWGLPSIPRGSLDLSPQGDNLAMSWTDASLTGAAGTVDRSSTPSGPPKPSPAGPRLDLNLSSEELLMLWGRVGVHVGEAANALYEKSKKGLVGDGSSFGFIEAVLQQIPNAARLPERSVTQPLGHLIYVQSGPSVQKRLSDVMPGDLISFADCKLKGHKALHTYHQSVGVNGELVVGVVGDFDQKKSKLKVYQANQSVGSQTVESVSYKLEDLKSGTIKIYRAAEART